jgi:RNA polymerase sigma-70 factor (ECF subfamily)
VVAATSSDPDVEVLSRIADGDGAALEELLERHQRRLLRLAERLLGDAEDARDAVQEVFLKVYRKAGSFQPQGKVSTWLYRVTTNHCLNKLRRRRIVRFVSFGSFGSFGSGGAAGEPQDEPDWEPPDDAPDPQQRAGARDRWRATRRAIEALPPGQRAVVVLAKLEGLSYKEVAAALGITVGAVESRLFRAMRTLEEAGGKP